MSLSSLATCEVYSRQTRHIESSFCREEDAEAGHNAQPLPSCSPCSITAFVLCTLPPDPLHNAGAEILLFCLRRAQILCSRRGIVSSMCCPSSFKRQAPLTGNASQSQPAADGFGDRIAPTLLRGPRKRESPTGVHKRSMLVACH